MLNIDKSEEKKEKFTRSLIYKLRPGEGKVSKMIETAHEMPDIDLFNRFKHIVRAEAAREFSGTKPDQKLSIEVRIMGDEILGRMLFKGMIKIKNEEGKTDKEG